MSSHTPPTTFGVGGFYFMDRARCVIILMVNLQSNEQQEVPCR